jgi:group I intron endonuclease
VEVYMFVVYKVRCEGSEKYYIGYASNLNKRIATHRYFCNNGRKTKFYDFARKHGFDNLIFEILKTFSSREEAMSFEKETIDLNDTNSLNLAEGGEGGFFVPEDKVEGWKEKLKEARAGRKPALGMKHTEETKKLAGEYGRLRWDLYGRYPEDVTSISYKLAKEKYGVSKTHYYRLKRAKINDLS